jgi:UDP-N-acetylglucosamine--N-acetylmuramyl-(pentapeptide) pyrophosphoryl-undecaprenol N-acetylglucosamine transferase
MVKKLMGSERKKLKVVVTGGGTGGHVYPAIAVALKLLNDNFIQSVHYIGCPYNLEKSVASAEGIKFLNIYVKGMPRKNVFKFFKWFWILTGAFISSVMHLRKIRPDAVFATGGYVSGPVILAAIVLRIKYYLHDCDAYPGLVTRLTAPFASGISVTFGKAKSYIFSNKIAVLGNPLRENLTMVSKEKARKYFNLEPDIRTILVMGGSQGAQSINKAVLHIGLKLIREYGIQVIHQVGNKNFEDCIFDLNQKYPQLLKSPQYILRPYFDDMSYPLNAADLVISRAGSLSISEINLVGLPMILIPYPYAAGDHQNYNAKEIENYGAGVMLDDNKCTPEKLMTLIVNILFDKEKLDKMRIKSLELARPNATEFIAEMIKKCI